MLNTEMLLQQQQYLKNKSTVINLLATECTYVCIRFTVWSTIHTIYTVYAIPTIYTVYAIHTIYTVYAIHTIYSVYAIHTIYTVYAIHTIYSVYAIHTIYVHCLCNTHEHNGMCMCRQ